MKRHPKIKLTCFKVLIILCYSPLSGFTQSESKIIIQNSTLILGNSEIPLWFAANNSGKFVGSSNVLNLTDLNVLNTIHSRKSQELSCSFGANIVGAIGETSYYQLNQIFAGINFRGWEIKAGQFSDKTKYAGLSTTNGNLVRSKNARPYPLVRISTKGYKDFPFVKRGLKFKGEFDEGVLDDQRFVKNPHIHHKSLYLLFESNDIWSISLGMEHFVIWGGTSPLPEYGQFPNDFNAYLRYISGAPGDENFPMIDQVNVAGDQLGSYQIEFKRQFEATKISVYLSHIFDAIESVKLKNWRDNLIGINLKIKDKSNWITDVVYEFTNTRHQGINDSIYYWDENTSDWERIYNDSYFTHFLYKSGYTYHSRVIGSPLFYPVITKTDESGYNYASLESTRFVAHHLGIKGNLGNSIQWKSMITLIKHLGSYVKPYKTAQKQFSGFFEASYINPQFPVEISCATAFDVTRLPKNNSGVRFTVRKKW